jgi:hypothetical protein
MKKILLIATIYRVGERIYPTIKKLSEKFQIDVFKTAQMHDEFKWYGDIDLRNVFDNKYKKYVNEIFDTLPFIAEYDLIIFDDDRPRNGLHQIYLKAKKLNIPVIANVHGNQKEQRIKDLNNANNISFDYLMLFGTYDLIRYKKIVKNKINFITGGIPANDLLKKFKNKNEHILVIVNFLGNRHAPYSKFDEKTFNELGLLELQKEFNKNIKIKLKSRADHPCPEKDFNYLHKILDKKLEYEIIMDIEDDNELISDSFITFSAPSTMSYKSIQKNIPTILLDGSFGQVGIFKKFKGLVELDKQIIFNEIERQHSIGRDEYFIKNAIEGGINYNSTEIYVNEIRRILNEC